ncbi:VOC family protein [Chelatococcus daeguensis]|uniref:VOC family protein n=1 Tax=Chelatococcus daeguensis TaxID=444444 RepID=UPI0007AB4B71|nr:VOC family protein [Chelatococcus daeguensis]KZE34660.1 glyoxalase [Chelatococcus daeguensis]MBM3082489.1 VOC family protein [Chelatococcus daeguensis]
MIDHMSITVTDLERAKAFYAAALAPLGIGVGLELPDAVGFRRKQRRSGDDTGGGFWIAQGTPCEPRVHVAFAAASRDEVAAFHAAALAAGGRDNGGPGLRPHYHENYFAAFVFDPDGYNIEAVCHTP